MCDESGIQTWSHTVETRSRERPALETDVDSPGATRICSLLVRGTCRSESLGTMSGPGVSICKSRYDIVIWRAENRTHLSKQTRPSTERSRKASYVRGILSRPDDQLRWVLIVRTQV